jgi:hypothetical protein
MLVRQPRDDREGCVRGLRGPSLLELSGSVSHRVGPLPSNPEQGHGSLRRLDARSTHRLAATSGCRLRPVRAAAAIVRSELPGVAPSVAPHAERMAQATRREVVTERVAQLVPAHRDSTRS